MRTNFDSRLSSLASLCLLTACAAPPPPPVAVVCDLQDKTLVIRGASELLGPGQRDTLRVLIEPRPGTAESLPASYLPQWSLVRGAARISMDGELTIVPHAPTPDTLVVQAHVGGRTVRQTLVAGAHLFERPAPSRPGEGSALVGAWRQIARTICIEGETHPVAADDPIGELRFGPNGYFSVTRVPLETRVDYLGTYTYEPENRRLRMRPKGDVPPELDLDLEGLVELHSPDTLQVYGMRLNSRARSDGALHCGSIWERLQRQRGMGLRRGRAVGCADQVVERSRSPDSTRDHIRMTSPGGGATCRTSTRCGTSASACRDR